MIRGIGSNGGSSVSHPSDMILCCGDALIDMLPRKLPGGESALLPVTGGAAFNTAIALGRLGVPAGFLSGLSSDLFGRRLEADLRYSGVNYSVCKRSNRPTTLAFVEMAGKDARYSFYDEGTAGRMLAANDIPKLHDGIQALHFGALSLMQEPCGTTYETIARREAERRVISLDPNIRSDAIQNERAYRDRLFRLVALSDIVKVSVDDLAWIDPKNDASTIREWISGGTSIVVLTNGARGATAYTANGEIQIPAREVNVVDTVGAGDAFGAGMLAGLFRLGLMTKPALAQASIEDIEQALQLASEVASVVVSRVGANPPWRHELSVPRGS